MTDFLGSSRWQTTAEVKTMVLLVRGHKGEVQAGPGHLTLENVFTLTSGVAP
jgi:hypothetical protein